MEVFRVLKEQFFGSTNDEERGGKESKLMPVDSTLFGHCVMGVATLGNNNNCHSFYYYKVLIVQ